MERENLSGQEVEIKSRNEGETDMVQTERRKEKEEGIEDRDKRKE